MPRSLEDLLSWRWPDALAIDHQMHDDQTYTLVIFDCDYTYTVWLACLSLDQRWTLSPRENARVVQVPDVP